MTQMTRQQAKFGVGAFAALMLLSTSTGLLLGTQPGLAQGPVPVMGGGIHAAVAIHHHRTSTSPVVHHATSTHTFPGAVSIKKHKRVTKAKTAKKKKPAGPPPPPQAFVDDLSTETIAPGVVHKVHRGAMYINLLDIDLLHSNVVVKPVLAGTAFDTLDEVRDQAQKVNAIAAINGNYFKRDGTPLGTLVIDGEWVAGPLYDRTCMGITDDGRILVDRVTLHGTLETSNPNVPTVWINNVNQPRRHGCHIVAYTRRWGDNVHMDYDGSMVAIDGTGRVVSKSLRTLAVPAGGFVLTDSKQSPLTHLNVGDLVRLSWHAGPSEWSRVVHAVSGGPVLIRDGQLFVDCKSENFRKSWTSSSIHARTAVGVTAGRHLLLATIEGPHTLWDVAKFLKKLGAVDAMNLDGGGSTTMVIGARTVTRNQSHYQRRVASTIVVLPKSNHYASGATIYRGDAPYFQPTGNITDFDLDPSRLRSQSLNTCEQALVGNAPADSASSGEPAVPSLPELENLTRCLNGTKPATEPPPNVAQVAPVTYVRADAPTKKASGRRHWMKKLNPLDW